MPSNRPTLDLLDLSKVDEGFAFYQSDEVEFPSGVAVGGDPAYAADVVGAPIKYDEHAYPCWFTGDAEGAGYSTWTPRLLRAVYDYSRMKDPRCFRAQLKYVVQALYDGIEDLGGDVSGMTRP